MENDHNNNINQNSENQNVNNGNQCGHHQGARPYEEHHHWSHHNHRCGIHVRREPSMCTEKYCAQKIFCKAFKILLALGIVFIIFVSGVVVGAHIGSRRVNMNSYRIQQVPIYERSIIGSGSTQEYYRTQQAPTYERSNRGNSSTQGYQIHIEPGHQSEREYFFKFDN